MNSLDDFDKNISTNIFWGGLSEVGIFLGIQNNMKIPGKELLRLDSRIPGHFFASR